MAATGVQATQQEVYDRTTRDLIPGVLQGVNTTVFAYGATGAGKTHTIIGSDREPGIIERALTDLFRLLEARKEEVRFPWPFLSLAQAPPWR